MAVQFAGRLSLIAFSTAAFRGLISAADFEGTLKTALIATAAFYGLGLIFGELACRVAEESARTEFERLTRETTKPAE